MSSSPAKRKLEVLTHFDESAAHEHLAAADGHLIWTRSRARKVEEEAKANGSCGMTPDLKLMSLAAQARGREDETVGRSLGRDFEEHQEDKSPPLRVYAVTWNLAGKLPPASIGGITPSEDTDIFAMATQECMVNCGTLQSFLRPSKAKWERRVKAILGPDFRKVASYTLNAMHLVVYARKEIFKQVVQVKIHHVATGFLGLVGNKGGIAVKFSLGDRSLCFINSHLSAHQSQVEERNEDWRKIERGLTKQMMPRRRGGASSIRLGQAAAALVPSWRSRRIVDDSLEQGLEDMREEELADFTIWMGDLNYRIDLARTEVEAAIAERNLAQLEHKDQLRQAQRSGRVAQGFEEGPLEFPPTYKFDPQSDIYDSSKKARIPAWTDRILFRAKKREELQLLRYSSCSQVKSSDHRPVAALFLASGFRSLR
uniref:Inositol polyphosphate-related phosphatase domain-containing protein n=1 Tax=Guillardia theta TaxID=55529 RepID=A0A7S4NMY5_GUITH|mmetsp:Transcript_26817/g.87795  ORF Transcript_26817/g.87795 Transcript_26817/m.87795 type:complete len:427 (+) Transcript_26817:81-1361(+)